MSFKDILKRDAGTVVPPKPLPPGNYTFRIAKYEFGESSQKKTPFVRFTLKPLSAADDVDEDLLADIEDWREKELRLDYYITPDALFRLTNFLEHCGLELSGREVGDLIPEAVNSTVLGEVEHSPSQRDPNIVYAEVRSTAKAE